MEYYLGMSWGKKNMKEIEIFEGILISCWIYFYKRKKYSTKNVELAMWVWVVWEKCGKELCGEIVGKMWKTITWEKCGKNVEKNIVRKVWKICGKQ